MKCRKCGRELKNGVKFCAGCGQAVQAEGLKKERILTILERSAQSAEVRSQMQTNSAIAVDISLLNRKTIDKMRTEKTKRLIVKSSWTLE